MKKIYIAISTLILSTQFAVFTLDCEQVGEKDKKAASARFLCSLTRSSSTAPILKDDGIFTATIMTYHDGCLQVKPITVVPQKRLQRMIGSVDYIADTYRKIPTEYISKDCRDLVMTTVQWRVTGPVICQQQQYMDFEIARLHRTYNYNHQVADIILSLAKGYCYSNIILDSNIPYDDIRQVGIEMYTNFNQLQKEKRSKFMQNFMVALEGNYRNHQREKYAKKNPTKAITKEQTLQRSSQ